MVNEPSERFLRFTVVLRVDDARVLDGKLSSTLYSAFLFNEWSGDSDLDREDSEDGGVRGNSSSESEESFELDAIYDGSNVIAARMRSMFLKSESRRSLRQMRITQLDATYHLC